MPQSKPVALALMLAALVDLSVAIFFFVTGEGDTGLIVGIVCIISAAVLFFLGLAFMPGGKPGTSSSWSAGNREPYGSDDE